MSSPGAASSVPCPPPPPPPAPPLAPAQPPGDDRDKRVHLHFRTSFLTRWGQNVVLSGAGALLGNWDPKCGQLMRCHHEGDALIWEVLVSLPWQQQYKYKYAVVRSGDGEEPKVECCDLRERCLVLPEGVANGDVVEVLDTWLEHGHPASVMKSDAFTKVIRCTQDPLPSTSTSVPSVVTRHQPLLGEAIVRFRITDYLVPPGHDICVSGAVPGLGHWQQSEVMELRACGHHCWEGELRLPYAHFPFAYKYALRGEDGALELEIGEQRMMKLPLAGSTQMGAPALIVTDDGYFRRDKLWRGAGVAVPVFSLVTEDSVGVGEFLDLIKLVDLSAACGLNLIQLLPVNDTSVYNMWWDSYPYSSISVYALHPQYLALRALSEGLPEDIRADIAAAKATLDTTQVDYEQVMHVKHRIARAVFDRLGPETLDCPAFKSWYKDNEHWLKPYAAFCFLRDLFGTAEHWRWGLLSQPTPALLSRLSDPGSEHYSSFQYTYWLQYQLHRQMMQVVEHAVEKKVVLKGDIPIGVDKRSVDTWMEPHLFHMDMCTGAPPDYFATNGQNWGFPTYNWEEMAKDQYLWWQRRLRHMEQYFSAYRIDHILGFFRIWEIPGDCTTGTLGHFSPCVPLYKHELESRGIWDLERLTQPYIRWHLLNELFGKMASEVAARYLEETSPGCFRFRPQFSSEEQIAAISIRPDSPQWLLEETEVTRKGLMKLRHNVVLLKDPKEPSHFFPRFSLMSTSSYKDLPQPWREALAWFHDDYLFGRQDELWRASAMSKLPTIMEATKMLVCGEDLGFVPSCVPPIMHELGLIGLRIQRMPSQPGAEFNNPANYSYLTVASPSCHDITPMRAWYEEDPQRRDRFYYNMLRGGGTPPERCTPEVLRIVIQQHLSCPSVWTIFPVQDLMALSRVYCKRPPSQEVINDPTVPKHYWRYRMHVTLEELQRDSAWVQQIKGMIMDSGRGC